jgi:hypothetical protein
MPSLHRSLFRWLTIPLLWGILPTCVLAQSSATAKLDHAEIMAGDTLTLELTFDQPATCDHDTYVVLRNAQSGRYAQFYGNLQAGKNTAILRLVVPKDYGGEFRSDQQRSFLGPCAGYSDQKDFTVSPLSINVKPIADPNTYPSRAEAVLTLTQKQFLETKAVELKDLSGQIDTRVEANGIDSADLRAFLGAIVHRAQTDLRATEQQYRSQILKPGDPLPTFFADFQRQYDALLIELKSPIPGTRADEYAPARLVYARQELKQRPLTNTSRPGHNESGTSPTIARATKQSIDDNAAAYRVVSSTGRVVFHARFSSLPTGATIYYRQAIEPDFQVWSSPTEVKDAELSLATFVFKFHKDGCDDEPVVTVDPYADTNPYVSVEFRRCPKK